MSLPILARNRGGAFAAGPAAPAAASSTYTLDASNEVTVTPIAHWDASKMDGTDNSAWTDGHTVNEAATGSYSSGSIWEDRTGNFSLRGSATGADQPVFVASHTLLNSKPAVDFEDKEAYFYETDNSALKRLDVSEANGWSVYIVASQDTSTNHGVLLAGNVSENGGTGYYRWQFYYNTSLIIKAYGTAPNSGNITESIASINGKRFVVGVTSTTASGSTTRIKKNGDGSFTEVDDPDNSFDLKFDDVNDTSDASKFKGHVAEMIFFDESLDDTDNTAVESYLTTKYDI